MTDTNVVLKIVLLIGFALTASTYEDEPYRYLNLPECIASVVVLPHIKQKINVWPNTDLLVGVGFPIELTVTAPNPPLRPMPFPPPRPFRPLPPPIVRGHRHHDYEGSYSREQSDEQNEIGRRFKRSVLPSIPLNILQRLQLYKTISLSLSKIGVNTGELCIQRAICEAAMTPSGRDEILVGELINVILKVPENDLPVMKEYNEAQNYGQLQKNCSKYFGCALSIFRKGFFFGSDTRSYDSQNG